MKWNDQDRINLNQSKKWKKYKQLSINQLHYGWRSLKYWDRSKFGAKSHLNHESKCLYWEYVAEHIKNDKNQAKMIFFSFLAICICSKIIVWFITI